MTLDQARAVAEKSVGQALGFPFGLGRDQKHLLYAWTDQLNEWTPATQAFLEETCQKMTAREDEEKAE